MIEDSKKLEELIYLSLIGLFQHVHENDYSVYYCFVEHSPKSSDLKNRPIYITSKDVVSDKLALTRLNVFERKIFDSDFYNKLSKSELNYSKRIKEYVKHIAKDEKEAERAIGIFCLNTYSLVFNKVISAEQAFTAQKYIENQFKNQKQLTK